MARKLVTMDGNNAAAHVSYAFTEVAAMCRKCRQSPAQPALSTVR